MAVCRSAIERKTPRRMRWRVILEKKFSTAFSQEAEVGVKLKVQRGRRASQVRHNGMLAGGVVVENRVDRLPERDLVFDGIEEADESEVAMVLHTSADD